MPWVPGLAVRMLTHEHAHHARNEHTLVVDAVVDLVRRRQLAGITVTRALEGLSGHGQLRASRALELGEDLPIVIELVDSTERIEPILPLLAELLPSGVLTVYPVRVYFPASDVRVRAVMRPARVVARPQAPLREVVHHLLDGPARLVPVIDERGVLLGIVTLRQILRQGDDAFMPHLGAQWTAAHVRGHLERIVEGHTASEAMLTNPETVGPETRLDTAARLLTSKRITRVPVVDQQRHLLGMLTERALVAALVTPSAQDQPATTDEPDDADEVDEPLRQSIAPGSGDALTAGMLVEQAAATLDESVSWRDVLRELRQGTDACVLVVDAAGGYRGVILADDVLRHAMPEAAEGTLAALRRLLARAPQHTVTTLGEQPLAGRTAGQLMRADVPTVGPETPVAEALERMLAADGSDIAVVRQADGRPLGLLRREEALRALVEV